MSVSVESEPAPAALPLAGLRIASFESRRSTETSRMIARQGGEPVEAPSLREVPLHGPAGLEPLLQDLQGGARVLLVLLTGVGTDLLIEGLGQRVPSEQALQLLTAESVKLVCRGPKPYAVLKRFGIAPALVVGEPNTWRDVLRELDELALVPGSSVYLQEYGRTNAELVEGISSRGAASVRLVKTYEWALPEDLEPLRLAIGRIAQGQVEVALFTSSVQVTHLLKVARTLGLFEPLMAGFSRMVVASVGPLTTEALVAAGLTPDIEPAHPKLGHLIAALGAQAAQKLAEKRRAGPAA